MDERRFLIEILLRARETVTQIAQKVAKSLDGVTNAQVRNDQASKRAESSARRQAGALNELHEAHVREKRDLDDSNAAHGRFTRTLERMGVSTNNARSGLRGLNAEFQGFKIALAIKYAQSLVSALVALGAQFVAVTAAAAQAAVGIGAALAAGAAQAVPVVGVLIAAFSRLTSVLKIVKLNNQQQLTASHDSTRAAKAQTAAADQVAAAQRRVADAHRNTEEAQRSLTLARKDAIRTVQDLMAAEGEATQRLLRAQQDRQQAIESGDVTGAVQGNIDVAAARRGVTRAHEDAAPVRARGVEGVEAFRQAERRLTDARRNESEANSDLARTRRESADNLATETAAADKLTDSLAQLSPAERQLYRRILALQDVYKRVARPITDIITNAFTGVVDRIIGLLRDPRIARGFRNIATEVARSIRSVTGEVGGEKSVTAFQILSAEAVRNIPIATRILKNFFAAVRNVVIAAVPAFRRLLRYIEDYSEKAKDASGNTKGLSDFFLTGVDYAKAFFDLALAVIDLLLTIAGRGGAADEGARTIEDLTKAVKRLTGHARDNAGAIRDFFHKTHDAFFEILGVVGHLAKAMVSVFSSSSVKSFADFLNGVIIPALANTVGIMGAMVTVFHQVFSLPGVAQVAQAAATFLLLARGLTVIRSAIGSILQIIPTFLRSMGLMVAAEEGAAAGFAAVTPAGWVILGLTAVVAAVVLLDKKLHFLGPTWRFIKRVAVDAFEGIKSGAEAVISWFSDVWTQGLLYWIRYPFVKAFEFLRDQGIFRWILHAAQDVIDAFQGDGFWGGIGGLIAAPFHAAKDSIKIVFDVIRGIVRVFLDVLAGRFDDAGQAIKDMWADVLDTVEGMVSRMLGVLEKLFRGLGSIPKVGGPFKDLANDLAHARKSIDDNRDATKKHREEQKKANEAVDDAAPGLARLRKRYDDATEQVRKLRPGTDEYKDAVIRARKAHKDYNDKLEDTANKANNAREPVRRLRSNIDNLGGTAADTADVVAKNLNDVLRQVGARTIRLNTRAYRRSGIDQMTDVTGHAATGGVLGNGRLRRRLWGGGVPNPYGGAADDHLLLSPSGAPVAALSGSEGIVNTPQMGIINSALDFTRQMTGMPWGSLNDLWGSGMRHYAAGGGLKPAISNLSSRLDRMFGLQTTSGYRTSMPLGHPDLHNAGLAADVSGTPRAMERAVRYIKSSGIARQLLEGIHNPGLSIKNHQAVPSSFWGSSTWSDHIDHIHLALSSAARMISERIRTPRISGLGGDALSRIARGSASYLTRAANRYVGRQMNRFGGGDPKPMGADANVVAAFRRAIRTTGAGAKPSLALWEAGIVESGLKNLTYGDRDSVGALQLRAGIHGRGLALNPYRAALAFLLRGFWGKGGAIGIAARNRGASAGWVAQQVQGSAYPSRYDQVRSRAQRYLQTGGLIGSAGPSRGSLGGRSTPVARSLMQRALDPVLGRINELFKSVADSLEIVTRGRLGRAKNLVLRIQKAFARITGDGGLLDQMREQTETIAGRAAAALQRRQFRVRGGRPQRVFLTDAQQAAGELGGLRGQRTGLVNERDAISDSIESAQAALRVARRRHDRTAADAAKAALNNLRKRQDDNATALAQNAQDQVEAQERFQQGLLDAVTNTAERQNSAIDRFSRMAKALGKNVDPNIIIGAQVQNMRTQIAGLQDVLARARRSGNVDLANQVSDQISELNTQIAEAAAQQFQNAIDAVNNLAQKKTARLDRATRIAQLGGQTDFGAIGSILGQRGNVLGHQRADLWTLLNQAQASGNIEQAENIADQIDELNTQLAENTQAIKDNTEAAFNFITQQINDAFNFSQTVFSGAQGFFQALSQATGVDTSPQQLSALQGVGTSLATQSSGLQGQLAKLTGDNSVLGLSGQDLVNYLLSITQGPAFAALMARLDPTQEQSFQDLVSALLGNATATVQNTQAIQDLTNPTSQSFSSTLWQTFRQAVFNGAGGLLPQYATTVPTAAVGAHVLRSGMLLVHAGENVRPASISRDWRGNDGDTFHLNVTTPTEVLDPTDVGRQLAFYRKTQGRR